MQQIRKTREHIEEAKRPAHAVANTLLINTVNSGNDHQAAEQTQQKGYVNFRPYDDLQQARHLSKKALSPKLIPYKKHSFSSSERSSDLAKNQEASQGQGHMMSAHHSRTMHSKRASHRETQMIHTNVNFSGVMDNALYGSKGSSGSGGSAARYRLDNNAEIMQTQLDPANSSEIFLSQSRRLKAKTYSGVTTLPIEILQSIDSNHPYNSFNITMMEEQLKIAERALDLGYRTPSQQLMEESNAPKDEDIPCEFLQYVSNGVRDELEQFAFQLDANHADNFPEEQVTQRQKHALVRESFGQKIFRLFKPSSEPREKPVPRRKHKPLKKDEMAFESSPLMFQSAQFSVKKHRRQRTEGDQQLISTLKGNAGASSDKDLDCKSQLSQSCPDRQTFGERGREKIRERNRSISVHSSSLVEDHLLYKPIYKLNIERAYTQDEWVIILMHSIQKVKARDRIEANLGLQIEHLSHVRVRQSFYDGLEAVQCESLRGEIWKLLCKVHQSKSQYKRGIFRKFIEQEDEKSARKIEKDLARTFPRCEEFKLPSSSGQNRLYNVLKAFSAYDSETGYVQGQNFITGMLLQLIPDQEDAFWCLVYVMFQRDWRSIFSDDSARINQMICDMEAYLQKYCRPVHQHLVRQQATMAACFSSQLITLFIYGNQFGAAAKIFELFLLDGEQVLVDMLAGMMQHRKQTILQLEELELMNYLQKEMAQECLSQMSIRELLKHPVNGKPITVKLTFNSVEDTIY